MTIITNSMKEEGLLKKITILSFLRVITGNGRIDAIPDNREKTAARKPAIK